MPDPHATRDGALPIVLLHGFTQAGASWAPVRAALGDRSGVYAPDLPGHGVFAERRPATIDACVAHLRALDVPPMALCGYSMGGRVALHAALAMPGRVARLVLVGATAGIADPAERAARVAADAALADAIERDGVEAFAEAWGRLPLFAGQPRGVAASAHRLRLAQTPAGLAASLRGMGTGTMLPVWDRLGELAMPVTLVVGARDARFREVAERMAAAIAGARMEVVAGAGHAVHLERPEAVGSAILRG